MYQFVFLGNFNGGWISQYTDAYQFFQIELGSVTKVTRIATQGRDDAGWWTKTYTIDYSVDGGTFQPYGQVDVYANSYPFKCFVIPPKSKKKKKKKTARKPFALLRLAHEFQPRFQGARPDNMRVESSCCCFHRELVSFDLRHVTRFRPIGKRI